MKNNIYISKLKENDMELKAVKVRRSFLGFSQIVTHSTEQLTDNITKQNYENLC